MRIAGNRRGFGFQALTIIRQVDHRLVSSSPYAEQPHGWLSFHVGRRKLDSVHVPLGVEEVTI